MKYWLLALSFLLLIPNFFENNLTEQTENQVKLEDFDPALAKKILSLANLESFIDSVAHVRSRNSPMNKELYANIISSTIRLRFFHSYSHYSPAENWMAAFAGKYIWYNLSAIVIADDILKYPMAACSQQGIVLMEFFKVRGIPFRKIAFAHHFAVEGFIDGEWIYFDPNLEPEFHGRHDSFEHLQERGRLKEIYKGILPADAILTVLAKPLYGEINAYPAPKARILHYSLSTLSHSLWAFVLFLFGMKVWDEKKKKSRASRKP